jgi:hypothetical protein
MTFKFNPDQYIRSQWNNYEAVEATARLGFVANVDQVHIREMAEDKLHPDDVGEAVAAACEQLVECCKRRVAEQPQ